MTGLRRLHMVLDATAMVCLAGLGIVPVAAQQLDAPSVIRQIDAAVRTRFESVAGFTVREHYAVYRGQDIGVPVAEITVKTTYRKDVGKSYEIVAESGSALIRKFGLIPLLDNEKSINQPGKVEQSWFTSANYEMKLLPGGIEHLDGRDCLALSVTPRRKAPNLIQGTLWVDAKDFGIVKIEGTASKSPSMWAGETRMMRRYANVSGFAMATGARAESNSFLFGKTVVTIDYRDYQIELSQRR